MLWGFDLMQLNGTDLRIVALEDRNRRLAHLLERSAISSLLLSERFSNGSKCWRSAEDAGWRASSRSTMVASTVRGRSTPWIKVKCPSWREANKERWRLFE